MTVLPQFRYHPDPLATGSVKESQEECVCCKKTRGYIYTGPIFGRGNTEIDLCPWCISDGSAHERLNVFFTDECGVGGEGDWDPVPEDIVAEISYRTPGFSGWQQEKWYTHCDDAAAFLGPVGHEELMAMGEPAIEGLKDQRPNLPIEDWNELFEALERDGSPVAFMFKCLHCGTYGGYVDVD